MLDDKPRMTSLQLDVIPALVRRQFRAQLAGSAGPEQAVQSHVTSETSDDGLMEAVFGVANQGAGHGGGTSTQMTHRPPNRCAHLAPDDAYCARVDTVVPALLEVSPGDCVFATRATPRT